MSTKVSFFFFFIKMSTNIVCVYADGNDPRVDMGNAGGKIIRGAFLGNILKLFLLRSFFVHCICSIQLHS